MKNLILEGNWEQN